MRKIIYLFIVLFTLSCDDGNLDIASFEFEEEMNVCGDEIFTLYRLSNNGHKEVLMLTLTDKEIKNDEEEVSPLLVSESGLYTVTDRVFEEEVTSDYFCAVVPPVEPKVLKNWKGISGQILVENKPVYDENDATKIIAWEHIVSLQDVVLKSGDESLIFNDTYFFGTFETAI